MPKYNGRGQYEIIYLVHFQEIEVLYFGTSSVDNLFRVLNY